MVRKNVVPIAACAGIFVLLAAYLFFRGSIFEDACLRGDRGTARFMLSFDPSLKRKCGSIFESACGDGDCKTVRFMLSIDPSLVRGENRRFSPFFLACRFEQYQVMKILLNHGANINREEVVGTPLRYAVMNNRYKMVKFLLKNHADINHQTSYEKPALRSATEQASVEMVKLLIAHGANVNVQDRWGMTPLHIAVLLRNDAIVALLIKAKANVNTKDQRGRTPLDCITQNDKTSQLVAGLLLKNGGVRAMPSPVSP